MIQTKRVELLSFHYVVILTLIAVASIMILGYIHEQNFMKECIKEGGIFYPTFSMGDYCLP